LPIYSAHKFEVILFLEGTFPRDYHYRFAINLVSSITINREWIFLQKHIIQ